MKGRRGIVILPAIAGVNAYIAGVARRFKDAGFETETVDYFRGGGPPDLSTLHKIMDAVAQLSDIDVLEQTSQAVTRLRGRGVDAVAAVGYCVGGSFALLAGSSVAGLAAVANYYGGLRYERTSSAKPAAPLERAAELQSPMIAHYGDADRVVPSADVDQLERVLEASARTFELFRYGGAPHAFDEAFRPSYRPVASQEAWVRTLKFLDWYVKPA